MASFPAMAWWQFLIRPVLCAVMNCYTCNLLDRWRLKFEGIRISVSGTFVFVSEPNFVRMCNCDWVMAIEVNFQNGGRGHLGFCRSEIRRQGNSPLTRIYIRTKFGEDVLMGGRIMAIYVFSKWPSAAILDFHRSEISGYFCFQDVSLSPWAKFCVNTCINDWVMAALKWIFKMAAAAILDFVGSEIWRQGQSRLTIIYHHTKLGEDILKDGRVMTIFVFLKWRPAAILDFQISEIWR